MKNRYNAAWIAISLIWIVSVFTQVYAQNAFGEDLSKRWVKRSSGFHYAVKGSSSSKKTTKGALSRSTIYRVAFDNPHVKRKGRYTDIKLRRKRIQDRKKLPARTVLIARPSVANNIEVGVGAPIIPVDSVRLVIPEGYEVIGVRINPAKAVSVPGKHILDFAQKPIPLISPASPTQATSANRAIYRSSKAFPSAPAGGVRYDIKHGRGYVTVNLYPVSYVPAKRKLSYYPYFDIELEFRDTASQVRSSKFIRPMRNESLLNEVRDLVDNPEDMSIATSSRMADIGAPDTLSGGIGSNLEAGAYAYVIITSEVLKSGFVPLRDRKIAKGLTARIVSIDQEIVPNYAGTENGDLQDKIRQFIRDAYLNWGTRWVLLGGDHGTIPARGVSVRVSSTVDTSLATDLYYACLDGTWDGNQNSVWGEPTDGTSGGDIDLSAEVYVGRAPVNNSSDVSNFVAKTVSYETTTHSNSDRMVLLGEELDGTTQGSYSSIRIRNEVLPQNLHLTEHYDENGAWSGANLVSDLNASPHFIDHLGHANGYTDARLWGADVSGLTNTYPYIMYSQGCYAASFDQVGVSIAEQHVIAQHGAIAVIMNTRYGWYAIGSVPAYSAYYAYSFWDYLFNKSARHIGEAHQRSKESNLYRVEHSTNGVYRWINFETTLLGDPETSAQSAQNFYEITGNITLGSGGEKIPNVAISAGDLGNVYTEANGSYRFTGAAHGTSYTLTPSKDGHTFSPVSASVTLTSNVNQDFIATLNTYAISGSVTVDGSPLSGVTIVEGELGSKVTEANGSYRFTGAAHGTSYTLTPSKDGHTFSPVSASVTLTSNVNQDFIATLNTYAISGSVKVGDSPLSGVTIAGTGGLDSRVTDENGNYSFTGAAHGTSYTLIPSKLGYTFSPVSANVIPTSDVNQDFAATLNTYTISGSVTVGGSPLSDVAISASGLVTVYTDENGNYNFTGAAHGTSYALTPSKVGYTFSPVSASVTPKSNSNQNFVATLNTYTISGSVTVGGSPLSGVAISAGDLGNVYTEATGSYSFTGAAHGTSYTLTPSKVGYTFSPVSASVTPKSNSNQNFVATLNTYTISGSVTVGGSAQSGVTISGSGELGSKVTDASGSYSFTGVAYGTSYTLTLSKVGYTFSPVSVSGTLTGNVTQDFAATLNAYTISGSVTVDGSPLSGVAISAGDLGNVYTEANGSYSFTGFAHGTSYTLTPSKVGYTFSPVSVSGTLTGNVTQDFAATLNTYTISGSVTVDGSPLSGVAISAGDLGNVYTEANGSYSFTGLAHGTSYTLTLSKVGYTFSLVTISGTLTEDVVQDFIAIANDSDGGVQELGSSVCADWNGYLGMINILENVNLGISKISVNSALYSILGIVQSQKQFEIESGKQYDLIVSSMPLFEVDSYGKVCSTLVKGQSGDLDGRMVYYKPDAFGGYQFAFSMPFSAGLSGRQYVQFNSSQVSSSRRDVENIVANWIQLTNLESTEQRGYLSFYDSKGSVIKISSISISGGSRRDVSGNMNIGPKGLSGLVEWIPQDQNARFQVRNIRYYYDNPTSAPSFDAAFAYEGMKGSGEMLVAPFDTRNSEASIDISNVTASKITVVARLYSSSGAGVQRFSNTLKAHSTISIRAGTYVRKGQGIVTVKGSATESLIATVTQVAKTSSGKIKNLYAIHASSAIGDVLMGSYNTYIGQGCSLLLSNPTNKKVNVSLSTKNYQAYEALKGEQVSVPAHGLADYNLCSKESENVYGVITVQPSVSNSVLATVLRKGDRDSYRFPTPVR